MNEEFLNKWKSQVKKGTLGFILLRLLRKKEMYGYELIEQVSMKVSIDIAEGTLYPLLNRLKDDDLISSKWVEQGSGIPRKYYSLTEQGRSTLLAMEKNWNELSLAISKLE
jgi:PadR family transcriptional regulator, regulatory protein PadR